MIAFDFEVFAYDWLVVFKELNTDQYHIVINDKEKLTEYYEKNKGKIFFGYNYKFFDNTIMSAIISGADPYATMFLLFHDVNIYKIYKTLNIKPVEMINFDLMQDILGMSLKEAEGYMNMSIEESSVPFDINRK